MLASICCRFRSRARFFEPPEWICFPEELILLSPSERGRLPLMAQVLYYRMPAFVHYW
jgi:hypothetical protein